jgi:hypothetical protein
VAVSSQFQRLVCILASEGTLEHLPLDEVSLPKLFDQQRRLAGSHDLLERIRTLWIGALLGERLERCSDHEIGDLLSLVQDGLGLFSPDFAVCEHAKRRMLKSSARIPERDWQVIREAGVELLNVEAGLFRADIPHILLPFQRDRFASDGFLVPSAAEARACLLRQGFRSVPQKDTVLTDSQTNRTIRLIEVGHDK